eukprot:403348532
MVDIKIPNIIAQLQSNDIRFSNLGDGMLSNDYMFRKNSDIQHNHKLSTNIKSFQENIEQNILNQSKVVEEVQRSHLRQQNQMTQRIQRSMKMNFKILKQDIQKSKSQLKSLQLFQKIVQDKIDKNNLSQDEIGLQQIMSGTNNLQKGKDYMGQTSFIAHKSARAGLQGFSNFMMKRKSALNNTSYRLQEKNSQQMLSTVESIESYFNDLFVKDQNFQGTSYNPMKITKLQQVGRVGVRGGGGRSLNHININMCDAGVACNFEKTINSKSSTIEQQLRSITPEVVIPTQELIQNDYNLNETQLNNSTFTNLKYMTNFHKIKTYPHQPMRVQ